MNNITSDYWFVRSFHLQRALSSCSIIVNIMMYFTNIKANNSLLVQRLSLPMPLLGGVRALCDTAIKCQFLLNMSPLLSVLLDIFEYVRGDIWCSLVMLYICSLYTIVGHYIIQCYLPLVYIVWRHSNNTTTVNI